MIKDSKAADQDKRISRDVDMHGEGNDDESGQLPPYDKYTFKEKLGEGTYGVVYKAINKETK